MVMPSRTGMQRMGAEHCTTADLTCSASAALPTGLEPASGWGMVQGT